MTRRAVVFDIGNVLIVWDRRLLYREFFDDEAELDRFLTEVYTVEANERFDRGQPLREFTAALAGEFPRYAREIDVLNTRWIETLGPIIDGSVVLARELRENGIEVYALSNFADEAFRLVEADEQYAFFRDFDGLVISGREGVVKPEAAIYQLLLDRYGLHGPSTVFFDDMPRNVDAALACGIDGLVFESPTLARRQLVERGLLPR